MTDIHSIDIYLVHTIDINHITIADGDRSVSTETDIPAFIIDREEVSRSVSGDFRDTSNISQSTYVWLKPDQALSMQDELVVDGSIRPVLRIEKPRDLRSVDGLDPNTDSIRYLRVSI